jgi:hypothetical protein
MVTASHYHQLQSLTTSETASVVRVACPPTWRWGCCTVPYSDVRPCTLSASALTRLVIPTHTHTHAHTHAHTHTRTHAHTHTRTHAHTHTHYTLPSLQYCSPETRLSARLHTSTCTAADTDALRGALKRVQGMLVSPCVLHAIPGHRPSCFDRLLWKPGVGGATSFFVHTP